MSTSVALALILVSYLFGFLITVLLLKLGMEEFKQIVLGVIQGVPVSVKTRSLFLHTAWLYYLFCLVNLNVVLSVINFRIAEYGIDPGARTLAYLVAFLSGFAAVSTILVGVLGVFTARAAFREGPQN